MIQISLGALIDKWRSYKAFGKMCPIQVNLNHSLAFSVVMPLSRLVSSKLLLLTSINVDYNAIEHIHFSRALYLWP